MKKSPAPPVTTIPSCKNKQIRQKYSPSVDNEVLKTKGELEKKKNQKSKIHRNISKSEQRQHIST